VNEPTEAGKRLREQFGHVPWLLPHVDILTASIEAEAARAALTALRAEVERLSCVFVGPAVRLEGFELARSAVLNLIARATPSWDQWVPSP
jgi:hypothetical protein